MQYGAITTNNLYIPSTIKIGRPKSNDRFIAVTFKNTKGAYLQATNFLHTSGFPVTDKPRNSEIRLQMDITQRVQIINNDCIVGWKFETIYSRALIRCDTVVGLIDPRGYKFPIHMDRFAWMLNHGITIDASRTISGEFCYCSDPGTNEIFIINKDWIEFSNALTEKQYTTKVSDLKKLKLKDLSIGTVYRLYDSRDLNEQSFQRAIYLGRYNLPNMLYYARYIWESHRRYPSQWSIDKYQNKCVDSLSQKLVFIKLKDTCGGITFNGVDFTKNTVDKLEVYLDDIVSGINEFSLSFNHQCRVSSLEAMNGFDNLRIRAVDDDQSYRISNPLNRTRTSAIAQYNIANSSNITYAYKTYTLENIQKWVNVVVNQVNNNLKFDDEIK